MMAPSRAAVLANIWLKTGDSDKREMATAYLALLDRVAGVENLLRGIVAEIDEGERCRRCGAQWNLPHVRNARVAFPLMGKS